MVLDRIRADPISSLIIEPRQLNSAKPSYFRSDSTPQSCVTADAITIYFNINSLDPFISIAYLFKEAAMIILLGDGYPSMVKALFERSSPS